MGYKNKLQTLVHYIHHKLMDFTDLHFTR